MDISGIFTNVATKMRADFEGARAAMTHPALKGNAFEETFRAFLSQYLPNSLDILSGQVVDSHDCTSKQMDVIVTDSAKTPVFYQSDNARVVPVECVYSVIEVKANLTLANVDSVFENMKSVKQLKKTAYIPENGVITRTLQMYGKDWSIWPVNYFVFAFESADLNSVAQRLQKLAIDCAAPPEARVDMVCVLDRGVICNQHTNGLIDALPNASSNLIPYSTSKSLLLFYALVSHYFNQAWLPSFQFKDYLGKILFD